MGTPGFGVLGGGYPLAGEWSASIGWRHQKSDRHFVGSHYEEVRDEIGNQVINDVNVADLSVRYQATRRVEVSLGVPYFMGTRSQMLRSNNVNIGRFQTAARGIGDMMLTTRRWMLDPDLHPGGNLQLGVGVKIPTGANNLTDTFRVITAGTITNQVRTVDQSIQPGDGGFGVLVDFSAFKTLTAGGLAVWGGGAYLATPGEKSNVLTYRNGAGEEVMSIADQYLLRGGIATPIPKTGNRLQFSGGLRVEGVPVRDIIGADAGFRRPGVAVSFEPSVNISIGTRNQLTFGVPIALYRNRFVSVPDEARGAHGDAAFADYLVMAGFTRKF
jgi:hypothetical protein